MFELELKNRKLPFNWASQINFIHTAEQRNKVGKLKNWKKVSHVINSSREDRQELIERLKWLKKKGNKHNKREFDRKTDCCWGGDDDNGKVVVKGGDGEITAKRCINQNLHHNRCHQIMHALYVHCNNIQRYQINRTGNEIRTGVLKLFFFLQQLPLLSEEKEWRQWGTP